MRSVLNLGELGSLPWPPPGLSPACSEEVGKPSTSTRLGQGLVAKNCSRAKSMLWTKEKSPSHQANLPASPCLHPSQYAADPQDKHWLAEQHHMRATGGKMVSIATHATAGDPPCPGTRAVGGSLPTNLRDSMPNKCEKGDL